ncbi:hypothetical protein GGX14DRAFT_571827 [Mycena pura]|uniref:Uncharacterized protein n=1 Tax=Mycena pura TaxID=153505 RepID=A0AAD6Y5T5_9AGAR|nr:hypothetical protein GGX14DRAFT_571827 [Mycena pura]
MSEEFCVRRRTVVPPHRFQWSGHLAEEVRDEPEVSEPADVESTTAGAMTLAHGAPCRTIARSHACIGALARRTRACERRVRRAQILLLHRRRTRPSKAPPPPGPSNNSDADGPHDERVVNSDGRLHGGRHVRDVSQHAGSYDREEARPRASACRRRGATTNACLRMPTRSAHERRAACGASNSSTDVGDALPRGEVLSGRAASERKGPTRARAPFWREPAACTGDVGLMSIRRLAMATSVFIGTAARRDPAYRYRQSGHRRAAQMSAQVFSSAVARRLDGKDRRAHAHASHWQAPAWETFARWASAGHGLECLRVNTVRSGAHGRRRLRSRPHGMAA